MPDLVGFGRSDKPARMEDHTYARHVGWMSLKGGGHFLQEDLGEQLAQVTAAWIAAGHRG